MRPRTILAAAAVLAAAPIAGLAALAMLGALAPGPALLAMAGVFVAQAGLALLWAGDLRRVASELRRVAHDGPPTPGPRLAALAALLNRAGREMRSLADRATQAEAARRTEAAILEALPEPVLVLGGDHRLRRANAAARREFGAEAAPLLRHPTLRAALDRAEAGGPAQTAELVLPLQVTREWQASVTALDPAAPGGAGEDRHRFILILLADRTRERAVERMRADFVTNASHELRTPLASLIGFIETLRGPAADDPAATQRFLGVMAEQAARMERLIADLLSLSRIEMNEHQRPMAPVDLAGLATRIAAEFEPRLASRKATLHLDLAADLPPVPGDADQLTQVLQNLLDNALRHGRESGGTIRLSARRAPPARPGQGWPARAGILVAVTDDGPGIPREHLPRLTERFYRVDRGRSRAAGGTGLGLAIVKHIVNRHRGQLRITSPEGAGACFTIWLPLA